VIQLRGYAYLAGGLIFGIALFRALVLACWAAALLAVGGVLSVVLPLTRMPSTGSWPSRNGVAIIGLGYPLWRSTRTEQNEATVGGHDLRGATAVAE